MNSSSPSNQPIIVWFRQDLRLSDNPALWHAAQTGKPVLFLYIRDDISEAVRPLGAAQNWWLHHSLTSLASDIMQWGGRLILKSGPAQEVVDHIMAQTGADEIVWNRRYGEGEQQVDRAIKAAYAGKATSFDGLLLHEPSQVRTGSDQPYRVYTPFWKKLSSGAPPRAPLPRPEQVTHFQSSMESEQLESWALLPTTPDWSIPLARHWQPGEAGGQQNLATFIDGNIDHYATARDNPGADLTSRLSPHLRFGEISPHQAWHAASSTPNKDESLHQLTWRKQLVWREFSYHLLQEWPRLASENFNPKFDNFPWIWDDNAASALKAWKEGQTGYPIVDAGMRQLYSTGWMHNRVRMIVASFLVKHLMIDWRRGEQWFWDTLVDGDPAANPSQWQWVAGTGADAAPYFRIFNPILQAQKFDPSGSYIHQYVPELARLPARYLAAPWEAPGSELRQAGIKLGETYPLPIVEHKRARERALDALQSTRQES